MTGPKSALITAAALRHPNGYLFVLERPNRHHHIIEHMAAIGHGPEIVASCEQGFITQAGSFLDRKTAWAVALAAGQVTRLPGSVEGLLFSENLW